MNKKKYSLCLENPLAVKPSEKRNQVKPPSQFKRSHKILKNCEVKNIFGSKIGESIHIGEVESQDSSSHSYSPPSQKQLTPAGHIGRVRSLIVMIVPPTNIGLPFFTSLHPPLSLERGRSLTQATQAGLHQEIHAVHASYTGRTCTKNS